MRYTGDGSRAEDVEVLLISSRGGGKGFCFPKVSDKGCAHGLRCWPW